MATEAVSNRIVGREEAIGHIVADMEEGAVVRI